MKKPAKNSVRNGKKNKLISTQKYLQFSEVHDDTLVLKNGGLRAVLEVSSMNFNLKSEAEQNAIIHSYQSFLNALDFPVQILVRSRKLDIDHYIADLEHRHSQITNPLLQQQMGDYISYISQLVEYSDIMEKKFFVVVPLNPVRAQKKGIFAGFLEYIQPEDTVEKIIQRKREFKNLKKNLDARVQTVKTALENCGLGVKQLRTEEIIQLFYQAYNPDKARTQKFRSMEDLATDGTPMDNLVEDK